MVVLDLKYSTACSNGTTMSVMSNAVIDVLLLNCPIPDGVILVLDTANENRFGISDRDPADASVTLEQLLMLRLVRFGC